MKHLSKRVTGFTLIELIIAIAIIAIIAIGLAVDAPRELLNTEKRDRLGNFLLSEIRTITAENISGKLAEVSGSGAADKTTLVISSGSIVKKLIKIESDGTENNLTSKVSLEAPFFGNSGYKIASVCGYYGTGIILPPISFGSTDTIEISVEKKEKSMGISYSGALNNGTNCGNPCSLGIIELLISFGDHDAKLKFDARSGVSSLMPLSDKSQFCTGIGH